MIKTTRLMKCGGCLVLLLMAACGDDSSRSSPAEGVGAAGAHAGPTQAPARQDAGADPGSPMDAGRAEGVAQPETCGNGTLDPGEACDDTLPKHRCPTSQSDCEAARDICWRWRVEGDGCHRRCVHAHGVCGDVLDPREPNGLSTACRNECPAELDVNDPWK